MSFSEKFEALHSHSKVLANLAIRLAFISSMWQFPENLKKNKPAIWDWLAQIIECWRTNNYPVIHSTMGKVYGP
jgi:hypothetical protein